MTTGTAAQTLPLPKGWSKIVRTGVIHALSVAATALTTAWSRAAGSRSSRHRAFAEVERLRTEIALLSEELGLKDARWARIPARRRPYYGPTVGVQGVPGRALSIRSPLLAPSYNVLLSPVWTNFPEG